MKRTLTPRATLTVVLLTAACSSGSSAASKDSGSVTAAGAAGAQTATVGMTDSLAFAPATVKAKVGTLTLSAKNEGNTPHNLTFDDPALGKTGTISGKETKDVVVTFDKAGTFAFTCTFHEGMNGKVIVTAAGTAAGTAQ